MTRRSQAKKTVRKWYSKEFKDEALAPAERLGVPASAKELGLHESQRYGWRVKARADTDQNETEQNLSAGIARLKRKNASGDSIWKAPGY